MLQLNAATMWHSNEGDVMTKVFHGVVNGKTIELTDDPGVPAGQEVEVTVTPLQARKAPWGEGLRRCAGALADEWTEEDDRILEEIYQQRKMDRGAQIPE
jgi:hypothetical protein